MSKQSTNEILKVPALRTTQGPTTVYVLFLRGTDLLRIADIRRLSRDKEKGLQGFQRKEIREHVNEIARYLDGGQALFPNAIILALDPRMKFEAARGPLAKRTIYNAIAGRIALPLRQEGDRAAWIVDGQQRSLALSKARNGSLLVPVVAFETASIQVQREQFILVNRARPLPQRLIDELLPLSSVAVMPRDLTDRQLPSRLCDSLDTEEGSPLRGMIRRTSKSTEPKRVITDSAILNMIRRSLANPNGALAGFGSLGSRPRDASAMLHLLIDYWHAVKTVFPAAWGRSASQSRLMHSVGIAAMGDLMDRIAARVTESRTRRAFFTRELGRIADKCAWTSGRWPLIGRAWDDVESTPRDVKLLSQVLVQLYAQSSGR